MSKKALYLFVLVFIVSCSPGGASKSQQAFMILKKSCLEKDHHTLYKLLSPKSIDKINKMCSAINTMTDRQRSSIADAYGLKNKNLKGIDALKYIQMFLFSDNQQLANTVKSKVERTKRDEKKVIMLMSNGVELVFVKEGRYWKYDLSDF